MAMELSEAASRGLQLLADVNCFDLKSFAIVLEAALQGLTGDHRADTETLDHPELQHIDRMTIKHCHASAMACLLEAGKQNAENATLSAYLEDYQFDRERIELFCKEYQKSKQILTVLLGSVGRCPPHVTDVSWRLQYQLKTSQVHKINQPACLVNLMVESPDSRSRPDISFNCSMEELQDMVGKLKDAAKSLERATRM